VQKGRNHIVLTELMLGGKSEDIDTAKLAVWPVLDEFFDCTHRFWLRRLSQSVEESVGLARTFHGIIGLMILLSCGQGKWKASERYAKRDGLTKTSS
jgi:hypothetical protein